MDEKRVRRCAIIDETTVEKRHREGAPGPHCALANQRQPICITRLLKKTHAPPTVVRGEINGSIRRLCDNYPAAEHQGHHIRTVAVRFDKPAQRFHFLGSEMGRAFF